MNNVIRMLSAAVISAGIATGAIAETKTSASQLVAPQLMTAEQVQEIIQQQRRSFEQYVKVQKELAEQYRANMEKSIKAQQEAARKHQQAMIKHMDSLRANVEAMAERTGKAIEANAEAQQKQMYGYMLGMMPEGKMKQAFRKAEKRRMQKVADMQAKRFEIQKKIEQARKSAEARIAAMRKKA